MFTVWERRAVQAAILAVTVLLFLFLLSAVRYRKSPLDPTAETVSYRLVADRNSVALFQGDKRVAEYPDVVLNTIPPADRARLQDGIVCQSPEEAERFLEDYDG